MTYEEAMGYLSSMTRFGIKPGLERVLAISLELGRPERAMRHLHVAGTNGKGSVATLSDSIFRASGIKTGLFTSPHLSYYGERIRIDGKAIDEKSLTSLINDVKHIVDAHISGGGEPPTEFEICTAMCLEYFRNEAVNLAVMEVGLGGRYDSTNIIEPDATVITHISYDHMEKLGNTLSLIAFDKCGVIKPGSIVVSARQEPEAMAMIEREAAVKGANLIRPGKGYSYELVEVSLKGTVFDYRGSTVTGRLVTALIGTHQADNAAAAVAAAEALMEIGWHISCDDVGNGLRDAVHPGRFEVIPGEPSVILDGAHNLDGAGVLSSTLSAVLDGVKPVAVTGFSADKDYKGMLEALAPNILKVVATAPGHTRSGAKDPSLVVDEALRLGLEAEVAAIPAEALSMGMALASKEGVPLLVCGSLYLIGEIRELLVK